MKIPPVEDELSHAQRWTDGSTDGHDEANIRFSQFCEWAQKLRSLNGLEIFFQKPDESYQTELTAC